MMINQIGIMLSAKIALLIKGLQSCAAGAPAMPSTKALINDLERGTGASATGTKFADEYDVALPGLSMKRHSVQANSLLDTD